jgi:superfamily II DNA or RNA helicase
LYIDYFKCKVLNEGVDIPEANSVAILYPKYSKIEITQMILRAGKWDTDKNLFHILFPITREEDLGGMEEVLISLASADQTLKEEIENLCLSIGKKRN